MFSFRAETPFWEEKNMKITSLLPLAFSIALVAGFVTAGEDSTLTIDGEVFVTKAAAPAHLENVDEIFSGWTFRLDETQALQMDDFDNPSFVFIDQAIDQFEKGRRFCW